MLRPQASQCRGLLPAYHEMFFTEVARCESLQALAAYGLTDSLSQDGVSPSETAGESPPGGA